MSFLQKHYPWLTGSAIFIFYLFTLAPSVVQIDSGELATVQAALGIAHPTGYPLFTIAGYLFSLLPLPLPVIYKLNLLSAVWCAAGVTVFIMVIRLVMQEFVFGKRDIKTVKETQGKKKAARTKKEEIFSPVLFEPAAVILVSVAGGLFLAFNKTYWFQSTSVEVYSLHIFLAVCSIWFMLKAYISDAAAGFSKYWYGLAVTLALGFSNHMTTILLIPGIAYLYFRKNRFNKESFTGIGKMLGVFIPLLVIIYQYLPIRAGQNPPLNWGNPVSWENFMRHVTGKQYQVWMFSSWDEAKEQLFKFITNLPAEFTLILIAALAGLWFLFRHSRELFYFVLILFFTTVLYSINYSINDIETYFLLANAALAIAGAFGVYFVLNYLSGSKKYIAGAAVVAVITLLQIGYNYKDVSQRGNMFFENYAKTALSVMPQNSVVLTYQWDYFISSSYYFRYVENYRKDIIVAEKELFRRSWMYNQIKTTYPDFVKSLEPEWKVFLQQVQPFERDLPYNPQVIEGAYRNLLNAIISQNIGKRDVFIGPEVFENEMQRGEVVLPEGYTVIPHLFFFKVSKGIEYEPAPMIEMNLNPSGHSNYYIDFGKTLIATMLARRADYEIRYDKKDRARFYVDQLRKNFPEYIIPEQILGRL